MSSGTIECVTNVKQAVGQSVQQWEQLAVEQLSVVQPWATVEWNND